MPEYIYLIHPFRDGFFEAPTVEENAVMEEHFRYLEKAVQADRLVLAGPCLDDTFGIVLLQAENDQAAKDFMFNDPSVVNNIMMAELHPIRLSVKAR